MSYIIFKREMDCLVCKETLPEIKTLQMFLSAGLISTDIYKLIEPMILKYSECIEEIETPCNVHFFTVHVCFECWKNGAAYKYMNRTTITIEKITN